MEFIDPLALDASSPLQGPHVGPRSKVTHGTMVPIVCKCGKLAEIIVDPDVPRMRCAVCPQVNHVEVICCPHLIVLRLHLTFSNFRFVFVEDVWLWRLVEANSDKAWQGHYNPETTGIRKQTEGNITGEGTRC